VKIVSLVNYRISRYLRDAALGNARMWAAEDVERMLKCAGIVRILYRQESGEHQFRMMFRAVRGEVKYLESKHKREADAWLGALSKLHQYLAQKERSA
jgi:hypothetical protein